MTDPSPERLCGNEEQLHFVSARRKVKLHDPDPIIDANITFTMMIVAIPEVLKFHALEGI